MKFKSIIILLFAASFKSLHSFDPYFYMNKYSDIPQDSWSGFVHYIHHGFNEGRECAEPIDNTNFDWEYYVKINNLNISTEQEAKDHYKNIGESQNLAYCKTFNIAVLLHLYNLDLMDEFIRKINHFIEINRVPIGDNINQFLPVNANLEFDDAQFNQVLSLTTYHKNLINTENYKALYNIYNKLKNYFHTSENNVQIIFSENRGADIGSFFLLSDQIFKENLNIDYIVKVHTKSHYVWRQILTSILN